MALPSNTVNEIKTKAENAWKNKVGANAPAFNLGFHDGYIAGATEYAEWQLKYDALKVENERLRAKFQELKESETGWRQSAVIMCRQHAALKDRVRKMAEALQWYADDGNYLGENGDLATAWKKNMGEKAIKALSEWNEGKDHVRLTCMSCGNDFYGPEPKMCCDGRECGCMGQPIEPVVCSQECYDKVINREGKEGKV